MWHEARKQERKIRGMMVDYKKRSERRRLYYHRIKADPTQFLRIQGVPSKIYVEEDAAEIESAASALMPWQGNRNNMIDRFDVRANLDIIPEPGNFLISSEVCENAVIDQKCQYERWRTLATNDLVGLGEEECLTQIAEDESAVLTKATKKSSSGAKIGFSYESNVADGSSDSDDSDADPKEFLPTDPDLDITFDVRELDAENKSKLNEIAAESYAIPDFTRLHIEDKVESEMREFEIREEQNRAERVAKLSKTERRKEKEERRKSKDVPPHMRVDDPYRKPHSRRSSSRRVDQSDSSSDEEKTVQNIEISSARSNTYKNVKSAQKPTKILLPTFLQPKTANSGLTSLVAARKQLLSKNDDAFDFGIGSVTPVEPVINAPDSRSRQKSKSSSKSPKRSRSGRSRSSSSRGRSRSRSRNRAYSRSRSRSRGRSRSRSRGRRYSSNSSRHRSRSSTRVSRGLSPRRKVSPAKDISAKPPSPETVSKANELPLKKSDSLKTLKPHERLKLKLQNQLKKRQRDEKKKEQALIEAKEQEAYERAEELRVLKRQMWEKEEEEYWKKREEEEREYQKKKAEERAQKADESSSNGEKNHSRSRSGSRRRQKSRSDSRDKSSERRNSKRARSSSTSHNDSTKKISLVPEYEGVDGESSRNRTQGRVDAKSRSTADEGRRTTEHKEKQRSDENRRRSRHEGDRKRGEPERRYPSDNRHGDPDRSRYQGDTGGERGDRSRHPDCGRRRDDDRGRHHEESRGRDRDRGSYRSSYR